MKPCQACASRVWSVRLEPLGVDEGGSPLSLMLCDECGVERGVAVWVGERQFRHRPLRKGDLRMVWGR